MKSETGTNLDSTECKPVNKPEENVVNSDLSSHQVEPSSDDNVKNENHKNQLETSNLVESNILSSSNGNDTELTTKKHTKSPSIKTEDEPPGKKQKLEVSPNVSVEPDETITLGAPVHEIVGGSSIRQYLNKNLTKYLLEGLRKVGQEKPQDPLTYLGEFLITKAKETADATQE
jgi:COMPASS component SDC1